MYEKLIETYVNTLSKDDIKNFALKKNVNLNENDTNTIYECAKKHWKVFLKGDPSNILKELEQKLESNTFQVLKQLYIETKNKFLF